MQQSNILPTPFVWRVGLAGLAVALAAAAYFGAAVLGPRGQSALGVVCFLSVAAVFSANLRALNWRTLAWGFGLQVLLALFVLKLEINGFRPGYELFNLLGGVAKKFLAFSDEGARFVFGNLAEPAYTHPIPKSPAAGGALGPTYEMARLHDEARPHLGFVFDVGHANLGDGVETEFASMKDRIRSTHVHDNDGKDDKHLFPLLATGGTVDWSKTMNLLRPCADQFPLVLELKVVEGMEHPLNRVNEVFDRLEDLRGE